MAITIRRATPNDAAAYARIMGDPAVFAGLMQLPYTDEDAWRARLIESCAPGKLDLPLAAELNGAVVGTAGLHPVGASIRRRHVMMLGISVASDAQGQGVGSALMQAMCDYADRWVGTLRLESAGYLTEVMEFVAPTVTPHNLLWRARRMGEPNRMQEAARQRARLRGEGE